MKFLDTLLHFDQYFETIVQSAGFWTYFLLFALIFCETGLVVTPFLPGDSLLFVAGTFAATGVLNVWLLWLTLAVACIVGDTVNYHVGSLMGKKVFREESRWFKKKYLKKTELFYEKYGRKTIILARFIPIVRTFAPFVAGAAKMDYKMFLLFNLIGGLLWVTLFTFGGYFFGALPFVQAHFEEVVLGIIFVSMLLPVFEYLKARRK